MKRILSFILTLILAILTLPLLILYFLLTYRRYLFHLYTGMIHSMTFHHVMQEMSMEE